MGFICHGNAVSSSRCGRAVRKVRPPTYFYILLFDLTPVPCHHLYSCRTHKNGRGAQGYAHGSTPLTMAADISGRGNSPWMWSQGKKGTSSRTQFFKSDLVTPIPPTYLYSCRTQEYGHGRWLLAAVICGRGSAASSTGLLSNRKRLLEQLEKGTEQSEKVKSKQNDCQSNWKKASSNRKIALSNWKRLPMQSDTTG